VFEDDDERELVIVVKICFWEIQSSVNGFLVNKCAFVVFAYWEKVTTTNFTTPKTKKNTEKFANHHYIKNHCLFSSSLLQKSERQKECEKNIESWVLSNFNILTTYGITTYGVFGFLINL